MNGKILAFDIGGTSIKFGLVSDEGAVLEKDSFDTPKEDLGLVTGEILKVYKRLTETYLIKGLAISTAGVIDKQTKQFGMGSPFFEAFGKTLAKKLTKEAEIPIAIENDGICAAQAERWIGNAKGVDDLISIVIGTAIGGAVIIDGQVIRGKHGLAGEFGFILDANEKPMKIWSATGSSNSLARRYQLATKDSSRQISGRDVYRAALAGDSLAVSELDTFFLKLAIRIFDLQYSIDPELFVIGGGISSAEGFEFSIQSAIDQVVDKVPQTIVKPKVVTCKFHNDSNLLGAAYTWLKENEK